MLQGLSSRGIRLGVRIPLTFEAEPSDIEEDSDESEEDEAAFAALVGCVFFGASPASESELESESSDESESEMSASQSALR